MNMISYRDVVWKLETLRRMWGHSNVQMIKKGEDLLKPSVPSYAAPNFIELLERKILINKFLLTKNEQGPI